jgi:hypothetical protein
MVTSPQDSIAYYLQTGGYGTVGTDIFVDWKPPSPSDVIVVTGYQGNEPDRAIGQKASLISFPRIQILVRDDDPSQALIDINSIQAYLEGSGEFTSNGLRIIYVIPVNSGALYLGKDNNNWTEYSTNFEVFV